MRKLKPPCTVVVQHILPALRFEIAKKLIQVHGLRRAEAAWKMGLTPAAVTQYMKGSRGDTASARIESSMKVMELVSDISRDIANGLSAIDMLLMKLCRVCHAVRTEGLICELHRDAVPGLKGVKTCACSLGIFAVDQ